MSRRVLTLFTSAAAAVGLSAASPAIAATTITLTGNSSTSGTAGNVRTFSNGGISLTASAFSLNGSTLETAYLGAYSSGLGVTNNGEGNGQSNSSHTADNVGRTDLILLVFNQLVNLSSATLIPFDVSPDPNDNDALVSFATLSGAFDSGEWTQLSNNALNVSGNNSSPYNTSLASFAGDFGNIWLIGAALNGVPPSFDSKDDGFKLKSIDVNVRPPVPEPATWAMMLVGFGMVGGAMRYNRRRQTVSFAAA